MADDDLYTRLLLHDLCNLLTAARFALEACREGDAAGLGVAELSVDRAVALLEQGLDRTQGAPADADCIVRSLQIARHLERQATLSHGELDHVPLLGISCIDLERALVNVLRNALTAAGPSGTVRLEARARDGHFDLVVVDDGPGMGSSSVRQGRGLGLRSTRRALEESGGAVFVDSGPAGTRIVLRVPTS